MANDPSGRILLISIPFFGSCTLRTLFSDLLQSLAVLAGEHWLEGSLVHELERCQWRSPMRSNWLSILSLNSGGPQPTQASKIEYSWISMDIHGYLWISMGIHRFPLISMDMRGYPWISIDIYGYPWISVDIHGYPWIS